MLRAVWVLLPVLAAPALADALEGWSTAPRTTAEAMAWLAWATGVVAVLSPRAMGLTYLRVAAPAALLTGLAALPSTGPVEGAAAGGAGALATALVVLPEVAEAFANGTAYGNERRFTLRTPLLVAWLAAPLAAATVAAGVVAGPLLLAGGRLVAGVPVTAAGLAAAAFLARSLHALSMRWLVAVPGGLVVHDPLTLSDPVLLPHDRLRRLAPLPRDGDGPEPPTGAVDLRLGVSGGSLVAELHEPASLPVVGRNRRIAELVETRHVVVAVSRPGAALEAARRRRVAVG